MKYPTNRDIVFKTATLYEKYTADFKKAIDVLENYQKAAAGTLSPNDELYQRIERVKQSEAAERKRVEEEKERQRIIDERNKRMEAMLKEMEDQVKAVEADMTKLQGQPCADPMVLEGVAMVLEQVKPVITEKDVNMAADIQPFLTDAVTQINDLKAVCAGAAPAPEPTPAPAPAPEGAAPAPAPEPAPAPAPTPAPQ